MGAGEAGHDRASETVEAGEAVRDRDSESEEAQETGRDRASKVMDVGETRRESSSEAADARLRKQTLRREAEQRRSALTAAERAAAAERIVQRAQALHVWPRPADAAAATNAPGFAPGAKQRLAPESQPPAPFTVLAYMPVRAEVDCTTLITWCWEQGMRVAMPKVVKSFTSLSIRLVNDFTQLAPGAYGILEPVEATPELDDLTQIGVIMVPGIAFDRSLARLGYGGGYYDRLMERFTAAAPGSFPFKLAFAYDAQLVEHIPIEPHDLRVDCIVTETQCIMGSDE